jgi:hypothetical protein
MSESARTLAYAGVAVTSIVIAGVYGWATTPAGVDGFDTVGTEFYPDFRDPSDADSLRVVAFNEDTATIRQFAVARQESGQWVIPTHNNYPADAAEQLNKTANSVIGIKRGAQKGSRENEHKEFGVLDPLVEGGDFEGRGKRITLKKGDDVLADYIIGNKAEDEGNLYYVRIPNQNEVFLAELEIDLSTKFSDWIETDLLKVDKNDLREVTVNKYSIDEQRGGITESELSVLKRDSSSSDWKLDGLNEETEELKTDEVTSLVDALDELTIVGVRPKPKGLGADLTVDPNYIKTQMQLTQIRGELQSKGFFILADRETEAAKLYANEGNVMAATEDGLVYTLNFGELFGGSLDEIEIGSDGDSEGDKKDTDLSMGSANNRYLFVSVAFDEKYLGEKPTPPAEPTKPEGLVEQPAVEKQDPEAEPGEAEQEEKEAEEGGGCEPFDQEEKQESSDEPEQEKPAAAKEAAEDKPTDAPQEAPAVKPESEEDKQKRLQAEWDAAQLKYQTQRKNYEADLKIYNDKVKEGKEKVDELNYRLGAWYYVISGKSFETLRLARADLVGPKEVKPEDKPTAPAIPGLNGQPVEASPAPAEAAVKPADKKPEPEMKQEPPEQKTPPEEPKASDKPVEANSDDKPAKDDKPVGEDKPAEDGKKPAADKKSDEGKSN